MKIFIMLLILNFAYISCGNSEKNMKGTKIQKNSKEIITFNDEKNLPSQIIPNKKDYTVLISNYSKDYSKIAINDSLENLETVYTADQNVQITDIVSNEYYVAWFEFHETTKKTKINQLKVYDRKTKEISVIYTNEIKMEEKNFQLRNLGIDKTKIYYIVPNDQEKKSQILSYNMEDKTKEVVIEYLFTNKSFPLNQSITYFQIKDSILTISYLTDNNVILEAYDLKAKKVIAKKDLPDNVLLVYSADYESQKNIFALYYKKNDNTDGVGIIGFDSFQISIKEIFTPKPTAVLYDDKIHIIGNNIIFNLQSNVSGYVSDHYEAVVYDYINDKPSSFKRCFYLTIDSDELFGLFFKEQSIKEIYYKPL